MRIRAPSTRVLLIGGLFALLAVVVGVWAVRRTAWGQPGFDITVLGFGEAVRPADYAVMGFGVYEDAPTAAEAAALVEARSAAVRQALVDAGIPAEDVRSTLVVRSYPLAPDPSAGDRIDWVHRAEDQYELIVHDATQVAYLLELILASGVNALGVVRFELHEPRPLFDAAYADALRDARVRAEAQAGAQGHAVGTVERVTVHRAPTSQNYIALKSEDLDRYRTLSQRVELVVTFLLRR
jgi:uncharacterized protein YggE